MLIELKKVKHFAAGSQETECFVASVYIDGVKAGEAQNDGQGGCTFVSPLSLAEKLNAYGKTLPKSVIDMGDGETFESEQDAESIIGGLLATHLMRGDLKKLLSKRILYTKKNASGIYQTKAMPLAQRDQFMTRTDIHEKWQIKELLNALPFEQAFTIYSSDSLT